MADDTMLHYIIEALLFGDELHCQKCVHPDEWKALQERVDGIIVGAKKSDAEPPFLCVECGAEFEILVALDEE